MKKTILIIALFFAILSGIGYFGYKKLFEGVDVVPVQKISENAKDAEKMVSLQISTIRKYKDAAMILLSDNSLTSLPPEIGELTSAITFDVANNYLTMVPTQIGNMSNLKSINLSGNKIQSIPSTISKLTKLELLDLRNNRITDVPVEIYNMSSIKTINLSGNPINDLTKQKLRTVFGSKIQL